MKYRNFGKTGYQVSLLGMGCMRLPFIDENDGGKGVNREKAYEMIRYAVDHGINYFDTALGYHGQTSEEVLGEALEGGMREKVKIATKQPFWVMHKQSDIRQNLENTLKKLRSSYVDFYLVHCITQDSWPDIQKRDILKEFEKFKSEGLIRHIGFSYHGQYPAFEEIVSGYPWEMCLIQQNLLDTNNEVTEQGIYAAHKNGVAVSIMEPLRGGGLCHAPRPVAELYDNFPKKRSATEWAVRHLANYGEVETIVSGMSNMDQLKDNIALFSQDDMEPNCLSADEKALLVKARDAYNSIVTIPCTVCNYCMPCPHNVDISGTFSRYNDGNRFEHFDQAKRSYMFTRRGGRGVEKCTGCGECSPKCPQGINIPKELQVAHRALDGWNE